MSGRRAVWRWNGKAIRRERRELSLVFALITLATLLCVGGSLVAFHATTPDESLDTGVLLSLTGDDPAEIDRFLDNFPDAAAIQRGRARVAGGVDVIELRAFDPGHPTVAPLLSSVDGRLPTGPDEVAITDGLAALTRVDVGDVLSLAEAELSVVGLVEDPTDLRADFAFVDHGDPPIRLETQYRTTASLDRIDEIPFSGGLGISEEIPPRSVAALASNMIVGLAMVFVGLLASSGFAVSSQRRMRQYGLMGAIGAEEGHLRTSAAWTGLAVGAAAAVVGAISGGALAAVIMPNVEEAIGHRVRFEVPLTLVVPAVAMAAVMGAVASWWPARAITHQSIVSSLSARRPRPRPVRRTTTLGSAACASGFPLLAWGAAGHRQGAALGGMFLVVVGVLLLTPAMVALIGHLTGKWHLPVRIAGRDLSRFQGRSAAALAAIVLALSIPVGMGVVTASLDASDDSRPPNLPTDTAIIWSSAAATGGGAVAADLGTLDGETLASDIAATEGAQLTPISVAVREPDSFVNDAGVAIRPALPLLDPIGCDGPHDGDTWSFGRGGEAACFSGDPLWVLTPEIAGLWDLDESVVSASAGASPLTPLVLARDVTGAFLPLDPDSGTIEVGTVEAPLPDYGSLPAALLSPDSLPADAEIVTAGWLLTFPQELTDRQVAALRSTVSELGPGVEVRETPAPRTALRTIAAIIGAAAALLVLGAAVALIRSEAADETRILDVLGASEATQRVVAGTTAMLLGFAGAVLAVPLGYLALGVMRTVSTEAQFAVPWASLGIVALAFPILAGILTMAFSRPPLR